MLSNLFVIACQKKLTHEQRVDTISNAMDKLDTAWNLADTKLLEIHKVKPLSPTIRKVRDKAADIMVKLNQNWKELPKTDASITAFVLNPDFASGLALILQLTTVADLNDIHLDLLSTQEQLGRLINEGN